MKNLKIALLLLASLPLFKPLHAQYIDVYQKATFVMRDSSRHSATVDARLLLTKNTLVFKDAPVKPWKLKEVHTVIIDSTEYFVKNIKNIPDTAKVMERVVSGKITLYKSPRISTNEELFVEKENVLYELRITRKYVDGRTFEVNEYVSYLKHFSLDCDAMDQVKVGNDIALSYHAILKFVTRYNKACGWQVAESRKKDPKPKFTFAMMAGGVLVHNKLNYEAGRVLLGKTRLTGFFAGPSVGLEFRKFYDTRVGYDLLVERLTGTGTAYSESTPYYGEAHQYDILSLKHVLSANISLRRNAETHIYIGSGIAVQHQVNNKTTWKRVTGITPDDPYRYHSDKDKFNMSPFAHLHYAYRKFGIRYQVMALSIQMKKTEVFGFEHRISLHYDLTR
jgi:hypothetical protein